MKNLYIKDNKGEYIPVRLELVTPTDLANKLIIITVGDKNYQITEESLQFVRESFIKSEIIKDAMRRSIDADLLIIPHNIRFELLSRREIDEKTVCIHINDSDLIDDLPEIKAKIRTGFGKEAMILPSSITLKEYKEIKDIIKRIHIRKQRHGGGTVK